MGLQMLKAMFIWISKVFHTNLVKWLSVGVLGAVTGSSVDIFIANRSLKDGEGVLLESCFVLNVFLVHWSSFHDKTRIITMSSKFTSIGLMVGKQVLFMCALISSRSSLTRVHSMKDHPITTKMTERITLLKGNEEIM